MDIFALDIGGAFIKWTFLRSSGRAASGIVHFPLYSAPEKLSATLKKLRPKTKPYLTVLTMTGELADCFPDRARGARHIVDASVTAFGSSLAGVFAHSGKLLPPARAKRFPEEIASANWLLPPLWLSRSSENFLFVDIGSTTTDLTPVRKGKIANSGRDDFHRLAGGELLYAGYLRTPVQSVLDRVKLKGNSLPLASEFFAVMGDVYLALGMITPRKYNCPAPDGGPKTGRASLARIARSVLSERKTLGDSAVLDMARQLAAAQRRLIVKGIRRFRQPVIATGSGAFILEKALKSGEIKPHPLHSSDDVKKLDPSRALALLVKERTLIAGSR